MGFRPCHYETQSIINYAKIQPGSKLSIPICTAPDTIKVTFSARAKIVGHELESGSESMCYIVGYIQRR